MSEHHRIRRKSSADAERSSLLVLGMHRSGTSAITGALSLCGAWVGDEEELTAANEENPRGFWERRDIRRICDRLLHASEADWWKIGSFDPNAIPHDVMREERTRFASIVSRLDEHGTWAIKEPRLCFLLPVLRDHITNPVCIHIARNPLEVARSLQARNGFGVAAGLALWETYSRHALSASENVPRALVSYEALALRPTETVGRLLESLAEFGETSLVMPDADQLGQFIDPSLYRRRADEEETREYLSPSQLDLWHQYCAGQVFDHERSATIPRATGQHLLDFETAQTSLDQHRQRARELLTELSARNSEVAALQQQTAALTAERDENRETIQAHETTIEAHETTIEAHETTIEAHETTIEAHETTIEAHETTIEAHETTIEAHETTIEAHETTIEAHETTIEAHETTIEAHETTIEAHETTIKVRGAIIEARDTTIRNLLNSTSWKLTAPLRSLSRAST